MAIWSVVKKNELEGSTRMDAEYYQPKYLFIDTNIRKFSFGYKSLKEIGAKVVSGPFGSSLKSESYLNEGVPFIRISDLYNFFIRKDNLVYISELDNQRIHSSQLREGDLVLSKVGNTIGVVSIITNDVGRANISENNIGIKLQRLDYGAKIFLLTFLNSKLGQEQILRRISGNAQPKLNIADIYGINFYNPTEDVLQIVENLVVNAKKCVDDSNILYSQAEQILLEESGLKDLDLKDDLFYTTTLKDVKDNNRMDAEYYMPKYEKLIKHLRRNDARSLSEVVTFLNHGKQPPYINDGQIPIFTQRHMGNNFLNLDALDNKNTQTTDEKFYNSQKKYQLKEFDILYYSVGAYLGRTNIYLSKRRAMSASFITIIRANSHYCLPLYLMIVLNSCIGKLQSFRYKSASAQQYIYPKDINKFIIPILKKERQEKISNKIYKAHEKLIESKQLLQDAKHKVEEMIEKEAGVK